MTSSPSPLPAQEQYLACPEPSPALSADDTSTTLSTSALDTPSTEAGSLDEPFLRERDGRGSMESVGGSRDVGRDSDISMQEKNGRIENSRPATTIPVTDSPPLLRTSRNAANYINPQEASRGRRASWDRLQSPTHEIAALGGNPLEGMGYDPGRRSSLAPRPNDDLASIAESPAAGNSIGSFSFPPNNTQTAPHAFTNHNAYLEHSQNTMSPTTTFIDPPAPFTFGTFRINEPRENMNMVGTPTAELGPFEYPIDNGGAVSAGAVVSPAIRRLVADEQITGPGTGQTLFPPGFMPSLRRTSSTSTVPTSPAGGRRPSVVHSNTVPVAEAGRRFSLVGDGEGLGPHSATGVVAAVEEEEEMLLQKRDVAAGDEDGARAGVEKQRRASANSVGSVGRTPISAMGVPFGPYGSSPTAPSPAGRRPSILAFAHQPLPDAPVPPSLAHLGASFRRGSIPANQFLPFNLPPRDRQSSVSSSSSMRSSISSASGATASAVRNSLSGPVFTNPGTKDEHMTVSSAYLYQRRSSLASTSRGLLSSKAPLPTMIRPGLFPSQQRTGSVSSTTSSNPSSSGSRESVMTIRDLRGSFSGDDLDRRPSLSRNGDSSESTATERSRRMSMPALPSPSTAMGEDSKVSHWLPQTQPRSMSTVLPSPSNGPGTFSFPPQVATTHMSSRPFTLGQPPSPRMGMAEMFRTERADSAHTSTSSGSSSRQSTSSRGSTGLPSAVGIISSSSEDLSDTANAVSDTPSRRTFRISQRGIQERERRRSSRMSALVSTGSNTLETIPSDNVVDFSRSARSSFSSSGLPTPDTSDSGSSKIPTTGGLGLPSGKSVPRHHEVSALSTSSSEDSTEEILSRVSKVEGEEVHSGDEEDVTGSITTAFRAFAFPPRNSVGTGAGGTTTTTMNQRENS